jgi:polysaccharide chain length determinant protein (PEP-CTERM system associated)
MRTEDRLNALSQQVMSRTELEKVVVQMDLYPGVRDRLPMEDVVARMRANINLQVVKSQRDSRDAEAFYVRFTYPDADVATRVTEKVGALYIDFNARDRGSLAEATNSFLETQLTESRTRLEAQERKLEQFRERNSGRLPTQVDFNMANIQNAQMQLQGVVESLARDQNQKMILERLYNDAQQEPAVAPPPVVVAPTASDPAALAGNPRQQLAVAREAMARLELRYTPDHPEILRGRRTLKELEDRVAAEDAKAAAAKAAGGPERPPVVAITEAEQARRERLATQRAEIEGLARSIRFKQDEEQRLRRAVADFQSRLEQTPGVESEWISLTRDYQQGQESYKDLLSKRDQSRVAAELERRQIGEQFRVLDPARRPIRPTGVARILVNGIAAGVGLVMGLLIAAFLEIRDTSVKQSADVQDVLGLPVLAVVPYLPNDDDRRRQKHRWVLASAVAGVAVIVSGYGFWALQLWKHIT